MTDSHENNEEVTGAVVSTVVGEDGGQRGGWSVGEKHGAMNEDSDESQDGEDGKCAGDGGQWMACVDW